MRDLRLYKAFVPCYKLLQRLIGTPPAAIAAIDQAVTTAPTTMAIARLFAIVGIPRQFIYIMARSNVSLSTTGEDGNQVASRGVNGNRLPVARGERDGPDKLFCEIEKSAQRYFPYATSHTLLSIRYFDSPSAG